MNKTLIVVGIVLGISGIVFTFLPHEAHNAVIGLFAHDAHENDGHQLMEHGTHQQHANTGWTVALAGFALAIVGWKIKNK